MPFYLSGILSGTALLIVVGVALEIAAQIESYLIEHRYEGFLASGTIKRVGAHVESGEKSIYFYWASWCW